MAGVHRLLRLLEPSPEWVEVVRLRVWTESAEGDKAGDSKSTAVQARLVHVLVMMGENRLSFIELTSHRTVAWLSNIKYSREHERPKLSWPESAA